MPKRVRSLRRKEAKRLRKRQQRQRIERWRKTKGWVLWVIPAVLAVLGGLGSLATLHGYYKSHLSVSPDASSLQSGTLKVPITVSNQGILSVNDVQFSCDYRTVKTSSGNWIHDFALAGFPTQSFTEIAPNHPVTMFCDSGGVKGGTLFHFTPDAITDIELEITVTFRPSFYPWAKREVFPFTGVRGDDGVFHWMPQAGH